MRHPQTPQECQQYLNGECTDISSDGQNVAWREEQGIPINPNCAYDFAADGWYAECDGYNQYGWDMNPRIKSRDWTLHTTNVE